MLKKSIILLLVVVTAGCATAPRVEKPGVRRAVVGASGVLAPVPSGAGAAAVAEKPQPTGIVFGKTDFKGLLKTAYVRLTIIRRDDPQARLFFTVGSRANQSVVPWGEGKVIEPGYFYLELPTGDYEISSLAIPVGSTIAQEPLALDFTVSLDRVNYLGTLDVDGTRERVKLGGVPVVKPGFEYQLAVRDDFEAASRDLESLLPGHKAPAAKALFRTGIAGDRGAVK